MQYAIQFQCLFTLESINVSKKQLKQYVISSKTVADALQINVLNTKTSPPEPPPSLIILATGVRIINKILRIGAERQHKLTWDNDNYKPCSDSLFADFGQKMPVLSELLQSGEK